MKPDYTFATYICSKDPEKITSFIWQLPYKIEIKNWVVKGGKFYCFFNHSDEKIAEKTNIKNIDLDVI